MATTSLVDALRDVSRPVFLFGTVPPLEGTTPEKAEDICNKFVARGRNLATDGYIVYDIQEEKGRTPEPRPFPFRRTLEPAGFAGTLSKASGKETVVYKCVVEHSTGAFDDWLDAAVNKHGVKAFNLVGGAASSATYSGPTIDDASKSLRKVRGAAWGGVTIAERHTKKGNEHENLQRKVDAGAEWFISQAIYDDKPTIQLIKDYAALCAKKGCKAKRVVLTFAPCGREKTMKFIDWLGVAVPAETRKAILEADSPVATSVEVLCGLLANIMKETAGLGVPLGVSVESVSIFREEIDATHDLFRKTQQMLLDAMGSPWTVRWGFVGPSDTRTSFDGRRPARVAAPQGKQGAGAVAEQSQGPNRSGIMAVVFFAGYFLGQGGFKALK
eukprot:CAMPEP_0183792132 /NCGR_PEP_ID=MMETSP0803_2-20130417/2344_1 /TAXON_ID=195967 /ORGANISM="Crustomastix stigmata, Strain CCMP3273" /LENGTH=385 /DNA_ID=CAMNT_0026036475 /DNA_START=55 /DNA_END=1212 /DNA_ORIENTATION=-